MKRLVALPVLLLLAAAMLPRPLTIWIAGDSTAAEKLPAKRPETGWGEMLEQHFQSGMVRVANRALNGRSTKSFIAEGHWQTIVDSLQPGDYVFVQFGHNDESKDKGERYTPPDQYRANLTRMVNDVRGKHAHPVLLTPVYRRNFDGSGRAKDTHGEYPDIVRDVAEKEHVPLIDMHRMSGELLQTWGPDSSARLFLQLEPGENANYPEGVHDNTHFRPLGARLMAELAVDGIRKSVPELARLLAKPD